jgi:hypothetical protein
MSLDGPEGFEKAARTTNSRDMGPHLLGEARGDEQTTGAVLLEVVALVPVLESETDKQETSAGCVRAGASAGLRGRELM